MNVFVQIMLKALLIILLFASLVSMLSESAIMEMKGDFLSLLLVGSRMEESDFQVMNQQEMTVSMPKKIYLYNTHQSEEYIDGVSIFQVTEILAGMLRAEGFEVVFETSDFLAELNRQNKKYNQLYTISRMYLEQALIQHGSFDLILDVHRDSASRNVSVVEKDGVEYARMMFVIGQKSPNADAVSFMSTTLTDKINHHFSGMMRAPFTRMSQYNQDVSHNMLLLEVGSDTNTSSEAILSLKILVDVLKKEGWS